MVAQQASPAPTAERHVTHHYGSRFAWWVSPVLVAVGLGCTPPSPGVLLSKIVLLTRLKVLGVLSWMAPAWPPAVFPEIVLSITLRAPPFI